MGKNQAAGGLPRRSAEDAEKPIVIEEDAVVAAAQTKPGFRRLQFLHIAGAPGEITVDAVHNLDCGLPIDGPRSPRASADQMTAIRSGASSLTAANRIRAGSLRGGCPLRVRGSTGAAQCGGSIGREVFLFHLSQGQRAKGSTITSNRLRTAFSFSAGSASNNAWACRRSCSRFGSMAILLAADSSLRHL